MPSNPCCCMSSRTGATIIGILDIIISAIFIICVLLSFLAISSSQSYPAVKEQLMERINELKGDPMYQDLQMDDDTIIIVLYVILICGLVGSIVGLFLASILIHGIRTENTQLLKFHLIIYATLFCISLVGAIGYLAMGEFLSTFIIYGLSFYFLMVIYYAYLEVRDKVSQRQTPLVKYEVA
ncbi:unnamed protein product [Orchesella dallaii]|uniref:Uncharacterized protein n=1 Tax=Orchesella dallaii TaxID=48710 RepID=A0ABP1RA04_9HEXA